MGMTAINTGFALAALVALVTFAVHTFVGGRFAARPLLADVGLPVPSRWLNYLTWHMVTALLPIMAGGFAWAAIQPDAWPAALILMVVSVAFSGVTVFVTLKAGIRPWRFPSSYLFLIILACGLFGLANPN